MIAVSAVPAVPEEEGAYNHNWLAAAALITMLPEVAEVSDPSVAVNVYVPDLSRMRLLNVATPFTAVAVSVLPAVKPAGPEITAIVTMDVFDVTVFPKAS